MTNLASQLGNIAIWLDNGCDPKQAAEELRQLSRKLSNTVEPEADSDTEDAARYRWLKANHLQTGPDSWIRTGEDLEEAIDASRR